MMTAQLAAARRPVVLSSSNNTVDAILSRDIDDEHCGDEFAILSDSGYTGRRGSLPAGRFDFRHEYLRTLLTSSSTVWSGFGAGEKAVSSVSVPETAAVLSRPIAPLSATRTTRRRSTGYRSLTTPMGTIMAADDAMDSTAVDTAPSSPPELSYSKSSKSSSSSFRSLSDDDSTEKLSHFEDITLEETTSDSIDDSNLKPESRPTLRRPPRSSSVLDVSKRNAIPRPSELKDLTDANRRGYPSLQGAVNGVLREQSLNLPMGRGMRRGFTSPSSPSFMMRPPPPRESSRSPSPSKAFMNNGSMPSPRSLGGTTPKASYDGSNNFGPFGRRQSWQPGRKTVKELEAEYDDLDEEVPDEAILENVPFTPIPGQPRASRTPSPQRQPSYTNLRQAGAHSTLHSANVPRNARRPSAPPVGPNGRMRSPRSPKQRRPRMPHSATITAFPPEPFGHQHRSKSWSEDLNEEARQLSAALEEYADRASTENMRSAPNSPPRPSLSSKGRAKTSIVEMPPLQKGNIMIDPLPISKEKEAVLTRTRPSWLPPKSQKEEKRHLKEWEQMMARATEAEKKRAVKEKAAETNKTEVDGSIARIWEQHVLPNFDQVVREPRTRELWWRGVTPASRGPVWQKAIGNELELSASSFTAALGRAQSLEAKLASMAPEERAKSKESAWFSAIARDVPTVFPELGVFSATTSSQNHKALADVLKAYTFYRSDVGYVYGTHLIAGLLCFNLSPANAFVALANLLNRPLPLAFLVHDQAAMSQAYELVLSTLKYKSPNLHAHLTSAALDLGPEDYLDPLFRCLFAYNLSLENASRIWDVYLFEGDKVLTRAAVAVLCKLEPKLYGKRGEVMDIISWRNEQRWDVGSEDEFMKAVRDAGKVDK